MADMPDTIQFKYDIISDFIEHWTSDDDERRRMHECLSEYIQMDNKIDDVLYETDYVIYHEATDYVIQFSGGGIVVYGDKDEAELDRSGDEVIIPCTDLPTHWKEKLIKQINEL
jgi:hypothetical protein